MHGMYRFRVMQQELKRRIIQVAALIITNPFITNIFSGRLYRGEFKQICAPGLNCYSCPAAVLSCPIGAIQTIGGSMDFKFSFYVTGFLLLIGLILGRAVCGFLCPFGLFQELLYKIPSSKVNLWRPLIYVKYFILIIFVIALPLITIKPAFCEYICPAGTFEAALPMLITHGEFRDAIGNLFALKISVMMIIFVACIKINRLFCKILCPLGAIYGLLNKFSFYRLQINQSQCIKCGRCQNICPMAINPVKNPDSMECIRCEKCAVVCPKNIIKLGCDAIDKRDSRRADCNS